MAVAEEMLALVSFYPGDRAREHIHRQVCLTAQSDIRVGQHAKNAELSVCPC